MQEKPPRPKCRKWQGVSEAKVAPRCSLMVVNNMRGVRAGCPTSARVPLRLTAASPYSWRLNFHRSSTVSIHYPSPLEPCAPIHCSWTMRAGDAGFSSVGPFQLLTPDATTCERGIASIILSRKWCSLSCVISKEVLRLPLSLVG